MRKRNTRKTASLVLALALSLGLSAQAFATSTPNFELDQDSGESSKTVPMSLTVEPTYTVTIPAEVKLGERTSEGKYTDTVTVTVEDVLLEEGKRLNVYIEGGFKLALEGDEDNDALKVPYRVTVGDKIIADGSSGGSYLVTSFVTQSVKQSVDMVFSTNTSPAFAGAYKDTVTFRIVVGDTPSEPSPDDNNN